MPRPMLSFAFFAHEGNGRSRQMRSTRWKIPRALVPITLVAATMAVSAPSATAALPNVSMDLVVVQAQVEPWLDRNTPISGDLSVKEVQRALRAKGFSTPVDGWYGDSTRAAYAGWQRRLGSTGNGANGIPGLSSLTKLGENRFTVSRKIIVGSRVSYSGEIVNQRTKNMVVEADAKVAWLIDVEKGSYVADDCSTDSACTHGGGGAIDITVDWSRNGACNMTDLERSRAWNTVKALRTVGFAAWFRGKGATWCPHIHAIAVGDTAMTVQAANQVGDYYAGKNGLRDHGPDNTPTAYRKPFTWWERYLATK